MKEKGFVYILTNPAFRENWVKIGISSRPVDVRSKELDNTAVPLPFEIYATMSTCKYVEAEKLVHRYIERFTKLRIRNNREFFNVAPEVALDIFKDVKLLLDDAVIDEVHKREMLANSVSDEKAPAKRQAGEKRTWIIPFNSKFFDLPACVEKYGYVFWSQNNNFEAGDNGYIYSSAPDSAIRYRFEVEKVDMPFSPEMEQERQFYVKPDDFDDTIAHNRFMRIRITDETNNSRLTLAYLLEHGLKMAPRGAVSISGQAMEETLNYIKENF